MDKFEMLRQVSEDQPIEDGNDFESEDNDQGAVENDEEIVATIEDKHQEL